MSARSRFLTHSLAGLCLAGLVAATALAEGSSADTEPGVWQPHEYTFQYLGFTSTYSCDGLADQLRRLLLIAGARADVKAEPGACAAQLGRPDRFASARLSFYTLAPAGTPNATGAPAQARWREVALAAHRPFELLVGDCELVEQFRDNVLTKMFTIRNLVDNTRCIPYQQSGSLISLRFEALASASGPASGDLLPGLIAYPKHGQSQQLQLKDRAECEARAVALSSADAAAPAPPGMTAAQVVYAKALAACLEERGYSVR